MATITLKGREIPLLYTTWEMKQVQEEVAPINRAIKLVLGRNPDDEKDQTKYGSAEHLNALAKMLRIMGNAGLEEAGEEANLSDKKVMRALKPVDLSDAVAACLSAMTEGMSSEIPDKEEEGPVDVTLEAMKKKEAKEN
jgi:hypothetical protein